MDLTIFKELGDGFPVRDFFASFCWKSESSISFHLCHRPEPRVFIGIGWLDVHETNDQWRRFKMRICLAHDCVKYADCESLIREVCQHLSIPNDSYQVTFVSPLKQALFDTGIAYEFVSYGPKQDPGDNSWDDRAGISPLEIISRSAALGLLLAACPAFHRKADSIQPFHGELFLNYAATIALVDTIEELMQLNDREQLCKLFDTIEKLVVYGDEYIRYASLTRLFESLQQRNLIASNMQTLMHPKTREAVAKAIAKMNP